MNATFTDVTLYEVTATCLTPLRTANAEGDTKSVLQSYDGIAMIQGTSIAGALRDNMDNSTDLFGTHEQDSVLIVSDGIFSPESEQVLRPRLRIDPKTSAGADGGKFDIAHIASGSKFTFSLTLFDLAQEKAVETLLTKLHSGVIRLGAQKSNGFGHVSLTVKKQTYHMQNEDDRRAWLSDEFNGIPLKLNSIECEQFRFTLIGMVNNLLVKSADTKSIEEKTVTVNITEAGVPIIPGSSLKGAIRHHATHIEKLFGKNGLCDKLFGCHITEPTDISIPGRVRVDDVPLRREKKLPISRIRINKFTGGVMRKALFTEEPLCGVVEITLSSTSLKPEECALLLFTLRDLGIGRFNLGGNGSIGRGYVKGEKLDITTPNGNAELKFNKESATVTAGENLLNQWLSAWEVRHDN